MTDTGPGPGRFTYEYPRAALAVDCVVLGLDSDDLKVLLIQRKLPPFQHAWALPGGFVQPGEALHEAALRELRTETSVALEPRHLEQFYTFGAPGRDPRGRIVSVAHLAVLAHGTVTTTRDTSCLSEELGVTCVARNGGGAFFLRRGQYLLLDP